VTEQRGNERTYHRLESPTQTPEDAQLQEESGEIWGRAPRGSLIAKVQAFAGPLPPDRRGIEFVTVVPPDFGGKPSRPEWSADRPDVGFDGEFARIRVRIIQNTQT
jgi:hypothetical protein